MPSKDQQRIVPYVTFQHFGPIQHSGTMANKAVCRDINAVTLQMMLFPWVKHRARK